MSLNSQTYFQGTSKQIIIESVDSRTFGLKRGMLLPAYGSVVALFW